MRGSPLYSTGMAIVLVTVIAIGLIIAMVGNRNSKHLLDQLADLRRAFRHLPQQLAAHLRHTHKLPNPPPASCTEVTQPPTCVSRKGLFFTRRRPRAHRQEQRYEPPAEATSKEFFYPTIISYEETNFFPAMAHRQEQRYEPPAEAKRPQNPQQQHLGARQGRVQRC